MPNEVCYTSPVFTGRKRQVLRLCAEGYTAREIGQALHLSPKTVAVYEGQLRRMLGLANRCQLLVYAVHWHFCERTIAEYTRHEKRNQS